MRAMLIAVLFAAAGVTAAAQEKEDVPSLLRTSLEDKEAIVWYLHHSGWAIKTRRHLLIFDPVEPEHRPKKGEKEPKGSLANGRIDLEEIAGQNVFIFVSHRHADHYKRSILDWKTSLPYSRYVFGWDEEGVPAHVVKMKSKEEKTIDGIDVLTIDANDEGAGFVVKVDGLVIFHAGDHAHWPGANESFPKEIQRVAAMETPIDLLFLPVATGMGDMDPWITYGAYWAMCELKPRVMFPMHSGGHEKNYKRFVELTESGKVPDYPRGGSMLGVLLKEKPDTQLRAAEKRGNRFHYREGALK